jgi:hypothetical protein
MQNLLMKRIAFGILLALAGYFSSYALLWESREDTLFALTVDRGCIRKTRDTPALRFAWMERSVLRTLTAFYSPINAVIISQTEWR